MPWTPAKLALKDFRDYEFILQELERFMKMSLDEIKKYHALHPTDALYSLSIPKRGNLIFSRVGEERFYEIASRGLDAIGTDGNKYDVQTAVEHLKSRFVTWQLDGIEITESNAHKIFEEMIADLSLQHVELTHFIPCSVVSHRQPERFRIGPVTFVLNKLFMAENEQAVRAASGPSQKSDWNWTEVERFFSHFLWVASITVPPCSEKVSKIRARMFVQKSLDLFKLFVGSTRAADVRQAYDPATPIETTDLVKDGKGHFEISCGRKFHGAVVSDEWYEEISQLQPWKLGQAVIERASATWSDSPEPERKFLDGLAWHGDAVSESDPQAKILKFWTAIERVVSLKENDKVARKTAILNSGDPSEFPLQLKKCNSLYGKRASVTHGSAKRGNPQFASTAFQVETLSRNTLVAYLFMLHYLEQKSDLTIQGLKREFDRLDQWITQRQKPTSK